MALGFRAFVGPGPDTSFLCPSWPVDRQPKHAWLIFAVFNTGKTITMCLCRGSLHCVDFVIHKF